MSLQKLLGTPRGALYRNAFCIKRRAGDMANLNHVVPSPPRDRVPFAEKMLFGVILNIGMWFGPVWVISHVSEYQKVERNKYLGQ